MKEIIEPREVTQKTYCRAETDRTFYNASQLAGGVNSMFSFRQVTPLDRQTVVRMNKDTLYTVALVDTSKGACPPTNATPPPTRCPRTMRSGPSPFTARMAT